ncbi:MAG: hypothetical protein F6J96_36345 [Symploca sp. SIO1C2]|nr:hypothetical protein [Symploca sp. SIO1C2]
MRTSIIIDDELGHRLREAAKADGLSLSAFLAEAGRVKLGTSDPSTMTPFELITHGDTGQKPAMNLDKTSELLAAEDQERFGL